MMDLSTKQILNNGAVVLQERRISSDERIVLALFRGDEFVTWSVSNEGDAYNGYYFQGDLVKAAASLSERAGGRKV